MGENIRQRPIRERAAMILLATLSAGVSTRVGLHLVPGVDLGLANMAAPAVGLLVAGILVFTLKREYPNFRLNPGEIQRLERHGRGGVYRIHLADGRIRRVLLTGSPTNPGTAHQLLNALPGAMVSGGAVGQVSTLEHHGRGRTTQWIPLTRAEALRELRAITQGRPAPSAEPTASTEPAPSAEPAASAEPAPSNTAEYLEQRARAGAPDRPGPELIEQWERDDAYGTEQLTAAGVRMGTFGLLRFLTWAAMIASLVYLALEEETDGQTVAITLWSVALFIGLIRGILIDFRVRRARAAATRLAADHPHIARRGMPEPWVRAVAWSPAGTLGILRAAAFLLALLFLIGLLTVVGDDAAASTGVVSALFVTFIIAWIVLGMRLARRRAEHRRVAEELAGPRQYWIDHPEQLEYPDEDEENVPAPEDSGVA